MIDFLNHKFKKEAFSNCLFICKTCKIKVWADLQRTPLEFYYEGTLNKLLIYNTVLDLTCEEIVIKNIIE